MATKVEWCAGADVLTADGLAKHVAVLASDEFEGRLPATIGEEKTIEYVVNEFKKLSVEPANNGSYVQAVPLIEITPTASHDVTVVVEGKTDPVVLKAQDDVTVVTSRASENINVVDSDIIFAGFGIVAPEFGWNDYKNIDVKGKTVVVLVNDPGFYLNDPKMFKGRTLTYYGRWTYKYEEAARQGAAACIIVHNTAAAAYNWSVVQQSRRGPRFVLQPDHNTPYLSAVEAWITEEKADQLFRLAGHTYEELLKKSLVADFQAFELKQKCSFTVTCKVRSLVSNNILGVIKGSERPDEVIIFSGHWDHFGKRGDDIFSGARDNGTGVAAVIEMAHAVSKLSKPLARSVLFFVPTVEEHGLLGSLYYADYPLFDLNKTAAVFNFDMLNTFGKTHDVALYGSGFSELEDYIVDAAKLQGRVFAEDPQPENGLYFRSDHFSFAKKGVPGVFIAMGFDHVVHGKEWMIKRIDQWTAECYHKPKDKYVDDKNNEWCWDLAGAVDDVRLIFVVAVMVANQTQFPQWKPCEFSRK